MGAHQLFHTIISVYIVFGWILYPAGHGAACVAIIVHWLLNKGRCVLSEGYTDANGFTTEVLGKIGIDISNKEWLKKLVPYLLVFIPGLVSVYLSMKDIRILGGVLGVKYAIGMMCFVIGLSIWQAVKGLFGAADSAAVANAVVELPTEPTAPVADVQLADQASTASP